jgi:hypothetical protein
MNFFETSREWAPIFGFLLWMGVKGMLFWSLMFIAKRMF